MARISLKEWLEEDFEVLKNEYLQEDKRKYELLFEHYIVDDQYATKNQFASKIDTFSGISIQILVYTNPIIEIYFRSEIGDLKLYAKELRDNKNFRDFTKLCFYIISKLKE